MPLTINPSESPEGLFSGRLHATNSSDEFAFRRRDDGYHSRNKHERMGYREKPQKARRKGYLLANWRRKMYIQLPDEKGRKRKNENEQQTYAHTRVLVHAIRLPVNLSKCLNVASLAGASAVNFIETRFIVRGMRRVPLAALALARPRIGLRIRLR